MRSMQSKSIDCIITDPPYGIIKRDKGFGGFGKPIARKQYEGEWDNKRPSLDVFEEMLRVANNVLIFGGNFFSDLLPVGNHWVVWDKLNTMPTFSDCELVWTNIKRNSVKKVTSEYNGLIGKEEDRQHATQKPVKLITYFVENYTEVGDTIFDPFMGSGTTGVAALRMSLNFIGCEIDTRYFAIAERRISQAASQPALFTTSNNRLHIDVEDSPRQPSQQKL
jgi:DNA modification methylase